LSPGFDRTDFRLDAATVVADLDELAQQSGGRFAGADRLAWTPQWLAARAWLRTKLGSIGLEPEEDAAGNLWATVPGDSDSFLIVGSHIDAVPDGGWLDGALGVLTALEVVRQLCRRQEPSSRLGVRFVDWADEEGARFGRSLLGSSACAGTLSPAAVAGLTDVDGVTLAEACSACGVDVLSTASAASFLTGAVAYLELHIEQGPVLLESGRLAAAVSGTFGVERHLVVFTGQTAHAGSTPMAMRRDSLVAAATAAVAIRQSAIRHGGVATVGRMTSAPGLITAIAGRTEMQLDQRHLDPAALTAMRDEALAICSETAAAFGCEVEILDIWSIPPTQFDPDLIEIARDAVAAAGDEYGPPVPSGALHDATEIGRVIPTVMIFAQSDPPVSHSRVEDSPPAALELAIDAYGRMVARLLRGDV